MLKVSQKYVIFDYFIQKNAVILNFETNESFSSKEIVAWYVNIVWHAGSRSGEVLH